MGEILEFVVPGYFGGCPRCGRDDGCLNVGKDHWYRCDRHRVRWWIGRGLFTVEYDDPAVWTENAALLSQYQEVKPRGA